MSPEALEALLIAEAENLTQAAGDRPLDAATVSAVALALIARHLGTLARVADSALAGDMISVAAWDMGKS